MDLDRNKRVVLSFYELAFNQGLPAEAADRYVARNYIQHNPYVPHAVDGPGALVALVRKVRQRFPLLRHETRRIIAEGDMVVVHGLMTTSPDDRGTIVADIFRISHGRITEQWSVYETVPATSVNSNAVG